MLPKALLSSALNIYSKRDSTISLGNVFRCLIVLNLINLFPVFLVFTPKFSLKQPVSVVCPGGTLLGGLRFLRLGRPTLDSVDQVRSNKC